MKAVDALDRWLTPERLRVYPVAFIVASIVMYVLLIVTHGVTALGPDFLAHWTGGRLLLDGDTAHLYDPRTQHAFQQATFGEGSLSWFVAPPFVAAMYAPLALLSFSTAFLVWTLISAICLVASAHLATPFAPRLLTEHRSMTLLILGSTEPVLETLGAGQQSAVLLLIWVCGLRLIATDRPGPAGAVLALGLFKPQIVVLAPLVFLLRRQWRGLAAFTSVAIAFALVSVTLVGVGGVIDWLRVPGSAYYFHAVTVDQAWKMQSLPALAFGLIPSPTIAHVVGLLVTLVCVAILSRQIIRADSTMDAWMLIPLVTVVASPHLVIYDLLIALPAILWWAERRDSPGFRVTALALYVLTWTAPLRHVAAMSDSWAAIILSAAWSSIPVAALWFLVSRRPASAAP